MADKIRRVNPAEEAGQIRSIQRVQGAARPRMSRAQAVLLARWAGNSLPAHVANFLAAGCDQNAKNVSKRLSPKAMRQIIGRLPQRQVETLIASTHPKVMRAQAVALILSNKQTAALHFDNLQARGKITRDTRAQLFAAMNDDRAPAVALSILLSDHNHEGLAGRIALARLILETRQETFEVMSKNWNESLREEEKAQVEAQKRRAIQTARDNSQRQAAASKRAAIKRNAANRLERALDAARQQVDFRLRHRSSHPVAVTAPAVIGTGAAADAVQDVRYVQDGHVVSTRVHTTPPPAATMMQALARPSRLGGAHIGMKPSAFWLGDA